MREVSRAIHWRAALTLAERELVRFFRQRSRLVSALGQPIIFWVLFAAGQRGSFRPTGQPTDPSYGEYFFPGTLVLIVFFTSIFATISIIEDRQQGFLQGVLVAPVRRSMVVLGKVLGGTAVALLQSWVFLLLIPFAGLSLTLLEFVLVSAFLFVVGVALTSLGACIAWRMDSTQGFHALMTVFLMPMWLLSGAFFPARGVPVWLEWIIRLNPVTYAVAGVRRLLYLDESGRLEWLAAPGLGVSTLITLAFAAVMFFLAVRNASRPGDPR